MQTWPHLFLVPDADNVVGPYQPESHFPHADGVLHLIMLESQKLSLKQKEHKILFEIISNACTRLSEPNKQSLWNRAIGFNSIFSIGCIFIQSSFSS